MKVTGKQMREIQKWRKEQIEREGFPVMCLNSEEQVDDFINNIIRESIEWIVDYYKKTWSFKTIVIDELSNFKSSKSQRFRALKKVQKYISRFIGLTGTPAPRNLLDFWSEMYLIDNGERLRTKFTAYQQEYFNPVRRNGFVVYEWIPKENTEERIYARIGDICMSLTAVDWFARKFSDIYKTYKGLDILD